MAQPNILAGTSIYGRSKTARLTTSSASILTCPSNKVLKVISIFLCFDGANGSESNIECTVKMYDNSSSASRAIAGKVPVPNKTTLIVVGKDAPIYLEESDRIDAFCATNSKIDMVLSYEELDDA